MSGFATRVRPKRISAKSHAQQILDAALLPHQLTAFDFRQDATQAVQDMITYRPAMMVQEAHDKYDGARSSLATQLRSGGKIASYQDVTAVCDAVEGLIHDLLNKPQQIDMTRG